MENGIASQNNKKNDRPHFKIENNILIGTELVYPEKCSNVGEVILGIFKSKPEHVGQVDVATGKQSTYGEMWERSVRCALWMKKLGVQRGDIITSYCNNILDAYVPLVASCCIGSIFAPSYYHPNAFEARNHFSITNPKVAFVHGEYAAIIDEVTKELQMKVKIVVFDDTSAVYETLNNILAQQTASEVENFRCTTIEDIKETTLLMKTSGTTGPSKYAELSHLATLTILHPSRSWYSSVENTVSMSASEINWVYGVLEVLRSFRSINTRIVIPHQDTFDLYCKIIDKYKVEWFCSETSMIKQLLHSDEWRNYSLKSLKVWSFAGSCFKREQHEAVAKLLPHVHVQQVYGSTDAGDCYTEQTKACKYGSSGYVLSGARVKIVNLKSEETLGPNQRGEIRVKTPTMITRYYKNPEATKQVLDSNGWLRTGDIGYYDEDGELFVVDRISHFIKWKDLALSPSDIEAAVERHPAIYAAAVIAIPDEQDIELPLAIVSKLPDIEVTEEELQHFMKKYLPEYYLSTIKVKFVNKLPRTHSGKILKNKLVEMYKNGLL